MASKVRFSLIACMALVSFPAVPELAAAATEIVTTTPFTRAFHGSESGGPYIAFAGLPVPEHNPFLPSNHLNLGVQAFQSTPF